MAHVSRWGGFLLKALTAAFLVIVGIASSDAAMPVLGVLVGVVAWRFFLHPSIQLTARTLIVANPIRSTEIPLADITSVKPGYSGLEIQRRDERGPTAWAVQRTNLGLIVGRAAAGGCRRRSYPLE